MDLTLLSSAIGGFGAHLGAVAADQWSAPTPCSDWDVREVVNHVAGELLWIPPLLEGKTIEDVGDQFDGDVLGDDPHAVWSSAAAAAQAAASAPGAQDRTVHLSFGDFPGGEYLSQITSDLVIHGWDVARAIGADDRIDPPLLDFVDGFLTPQVDAWRSAGAFGPAVDVDANADTQDRLIANTGRPPDWTA
jgi:uncharacterized protein (TIGR03086 family)